MTIYPNIVIYLDNIIVTGPTEELYLEILGEVFRRIQEFGLKLRREKYALMAYQLQNRCTRVPPLFCITRQIKKGIINLVTGARLS